MKQRSSGKRIFWRKKDIGAFSPDHISIVDSEDIGLVGPWGRRLDCLALMVRGVGAYIILCSGKEETGRCAVLINYASHCSQRNCLHVSRWINQYNGGASMVIIIKLGAVAGLW